MTNIPHIVKLPERITPFIGRESEVIKFIRNLKNDHFIWVTGESGVGKSAFLKTMSHEVFQRDIFPEGVFYISIKD